MERVSHNPYVLLRNCEDVTKIDGLLDEVGIPPEKLRERLLCLYDIMGVRGTFSARDMTLEEDYESAKIELVSQVWKDLS